MPASIEAEMMIPGEKGQGTSRATMFTSKAD